MNEGAEIAKKYSEFSGSKTNSYEARNTSIFNNSIIEFKNRPISQSCVPVALIFEFNIELLNKMCY